jgi:hypothetical protein
MIQILAQSKSLKRVYLVGIHPSSLLSALPSLSPTADSALSKRLTPKMVV